MTLQTAVDPSGELALRWTAFREANPRVRIRDAAEQLGTSEAELLALGVGVELRRLRPEFPAILSAVPALGKVMALTRNDHAVHERRGTYLEVEASERHVLVLGPDIDLRLFPSSWHLGFAVVEATARGTRRSLQFFDRQGTAVHKIYLEEESDVSSFEELVKCFEQDPPAPLDLAPRAPPSATVPANEVDANALRKAWSELADPHDFFGMLRRFRVTRTDALALAGAPHAVKVPNETFERLLERASADQLPIMVFVGNRSAIQIHTGPVKNLKRMGEWMNVLDPEFNLHVRTDRIASAWVVRKPSAEGTITSLEVFAADGELILQLFGKRKPGIPELAEWRALVATVLPEAA